jgi:hypothetical protein
LSLYLRKTIQFSKASKVISVYIRSTIHGYFLATHSLAIVVHLLIFIQSAIKYVATPVWPRSLQEEEEEVEDASSNAKIVFKTNKIYN